MYLKKLHVAAVAGTLLVGVVPAAAVAETVLRLDEVAVGELDPAKGSDYADSILMFNAYDALLTTPAGGGAPAPHLVESWTAEGNSFTFKLREDVTFHSGNAMTADDVVFSYERLAALGQGFSNLFRGWVDTVEAVDEHTVRFNLTAQYAPFISALVRMIVVDKETVMANLADGDFGDLGDYGQAYLSENSAGTGAYVVESHNPQEITVLRKNPDYFLGVPAEAPDVVRLRYGLEGATVRAMMARGEHEITSQWIAPEIKRALNDSDGIGLVQEGGLGGFYVKLNTQKAPLDDVACRQALAHAIDYDTMIKIRSITDDVAEGKPARGPLPQGMLGYSTDIPMGARDLDKARELVSQCQYDPADHKLEISWVAEVAVEERFALLMQQNFKEIGFDSDVVRVPWALFTERVTAVDSTPHISQVFVTATAPDPDSLIYTMYHSSTAGTWRSPEWVNDPQLDELLDRGRATLDQAERQEIYEQVSARLIELQPTIYAFENVSVFPAVEAVEIPALSDPAKAHNVQGQNFMFREMVMKQ